MTPTDDFIQMFSDVVMEVGKKYFEQLIDKMKEAEGCSVRYRTGLLLILKTSG